MIFVGANGHRGIMSTLGAHALMDIETALRHDDRVAACAEVVLCGTYLLPRFGPAAALPYAKRLRGRGQVVAFDPSWDPAGWSESTRAGTLALLPEIDVYLPNEPELLHLTGKDCLDDAIAIVAALAGELIVKRGADGALYVRGNERIAVPGFPVEAANTIGAGDVFDAAYLYARRSGWPRSSGCGSRMRWPRWSCRSAAPERIPIRNRYFVLPVSTTMPTARTRDLLCRAQTAGEGIPAFNVIGIEHAEAIVRGAEAAGAPVILQLSQNAVKYHFGAIEPIGHACAELAHAASVPVALHLDHATSMELCERAVACGFTSVMLDTADLPYEENVARTAELVGWAHRQGVCGRSGDRDRRRQGWRCDHDGWHDPAGGRARVHGRNWRGCARRRDRHDPLDARPYRDDRSRPARAVSAPRLAAPLVLHGSSGVPDADLAAAVRHGITKVNLATQLNIVFTAAVRQHLAADPDVTDPRQYLAGARQAVADLVADRIAL